MPTPRWLKNLIDLVPPVRESRRFRYFDFWQPRPFQPDDRHFRLSNAGWLAEASMLAYSSPEDITAWVPPPWFGGFRHVGHEILITSSGILIEGPSVLFELSDLVRGYFRQARRALGGDVASVAIDSIYDHSPLLYVRCLRQCSIAR